MNRKQAMELAKSISTESLQEMFKNALEKVPNWQKRSRVNKTMTLGVTFNILTKTPLTAESHNLAKKNAIMEFYEYLPGYEKPQKQKTIPPNPVHQEPIKPSFLDE